LNFSIFLGAKSPDLNIIEPLWSVLKTRVRNRFPLPTSLKQLEDVRQEELYKFPLETTQNLYESIPRRIAPLLKTKVVQRHINKETYTVSVVFPLLCPTPACFLAKSLKVFLASLHRKCCSTKGVIAIISSHVRIFSPEETWF
jgi:hypothetical protein